MGRFEAQGRSQCRISAARDRQNRETLMMGHLHIVERLLCIVRGKPETLVPSPMEPKMTLPSGTWKRAFSRFSLGEK